MVAKIRQQKIAERIREEVSELLIGELTDPRVMGLIVTDVTVDRELAYATIFVSSYDAEDRKKDVLEGLDSARNFIRYQLSQRIDLRSFPQIRFKWDSTPQRAERIDKLFDALAQEEKQKKESTSEDAHL
ncbi:MAG: 30S ribosome-binding factor RbfA [Anaerolineales bacterium]|nr:30S ribosome-binding factor RbfA [Anaerolineales bacterium]